MANMSYCRFQNTVMDFEDCLNDLKERASTCGGINEYGDKLSSEERRSAEQLARLSKDYLDAYAEFKDAEYLFTDES